MKSLSQVYAALNKFDKKQATPYPILVLSNQVINTLEPYLNFFLNQRQLASEFQYGDYDNVLQECLRPSSPLLNEDTASVLLLLNPFKISSNLVAEDILRYISTCIENIRQKTTGLILVYTFNQCPYPLEGIMGEASHAGSNAKIRKINALLEETLDHYKNAHLINMDLCLMRVGESAFYDHRSRYSFQNPYSLQAYETIAQETAKYIFSSQGKSKKCLILDADHVLWGGVLGEDPWDEIALGVDYPGSIYQEFQNTVLALHDAGIILALCSKNNEADVWHFFETRPAMILKPQHFAAYEINWNNKADNIQKIAKELNIHLNSIVFSDDSPNEIEWVQGHLPEVSTLHLPIETAHLNSKLLLSTGYFDRLNLTDEDRYRSQHYQEQKLRSNLSRTYENIDSFLTDLNMELTIKEASPVELNRLAQLTQKTNQFNLTTRRYNESQMLELIHSPHSKVFYAHLKDKFGDFGIIGLTITHYRNDYSAEIDSLLLSCRALGRGVEKCLLHASIDEAFSHNTDLVHADYIASSANQQTALFYKEHGFIPISKSDKQVRHQLTRESYQPTRPNYYMHLSSPHFTYSREQNHAK